LGPLKTGFVLLYANGKWEAGLFNDFDGVVGTLYLARSADKAFVEVYDNRFLVSNLKDFYGADVHAGSTSIALFEVDLDLHHEVSPSF
jgi:hypothetical protein